MTKRVKTYPLDQCPFFKLYSVKRLCRLLGVNRGQLNHLVSSEQNYNVFNKVVRGKVRTIEAPKLLLASVHSSIFKLLSRIHVPDYLHSGVRGRSYITNATAHDGHKAGFKLDIKAFYPSTTWEHVYQSFKRQFRCNHAVAKNLATLLTINGHLPTGSTVSQCMAFFAHREMFDRIHHVANEFGGQPTVYVDDLYISIGNVRRWQLKRIGRIINANKLEWHKERVYQPDSPKLVTGVVLSPDGTRLPNSKHLKLKETYKKLRGTNELGTRLPSARSLAGQLTTGSLLDSKLAKRARPARGYQRYLERQ